MRGEQKWKSEARRWRRRPLREDAHRRAHDNATNRRSPSPKQPAARLARTRQCGTPRISVSEHAGLPHHLRLDRCARRDTCTQGPRRSAATLGSVTVVPSGRKNRTRSKSQRDGPNEARGEPRCAAEPLECGRPHVVGRVQDIDTLRRYPSPKPPADDLAGVIRHATCRRFLFSATRSPSIAPFVAPRLQLRQRAPRPQSAAISM